jgi:uncharacterized phage protein gp47/JayE
VSCSGACANGCSCGDGCRNGCKAATPATLQPTSNRPGLPALSYRVGTQTAFTAAMAARLSSAAHPELAGLRTRELSDPAMALIDAWALAGDVLTFYQERIANEGYLRTATQRHSVLALAALIGYRPRPGVAADAYLAYTVDATSSPVTIPAGSRSNTIPGPGQSMQAFETSDDVAARAQWNQLRPRMSQAQTAASVSVGDLYLAGTSSGLKPNDALVIDLGSGDLAPARVGAVTPNAGAGWTHVGLLDWDGGPFSTTVLHHAVTAVGEGFAAAPDSATAQRVRELLAELHSKSATQSTAELRHYVANTVTPQLRDELAAARERGYSRLVPLLESTIAKAGRVAAVAGAAEKGGGPGGGEYRQNPLDVLLGQLTLPGSVPPASSPNLARSYQSTFAGAGDVFPKLLAALTPALAPTLYPALANTPVSAGTGLLVYALRQGASLFGHNAPPQYSFNSKGVPTQLPEWALASDEDAHIAHLDGAHDTVQAGSYVIAQRGPSARKGAETPTLAIVKTATTGSRLAYGMAGKSTTLTLERPWWNPKNKEGAGDDADGMGALRGGTIYCQSEQLALAQAPITDDIGANIIELDGLYDGLTAGRWAIVSGERTDVGTAAGATTGITGVELVMIAGVSQGARTGDGQVLEGEDRHTTLTLAKALAYSYKRDTVSISGNVAHATHGESRVEVLGSGNAAMPMQQFTLKQFPLTYVSAPTPAGAASTLVVRVNQVQWHEAQGLSYLGVADRGYLSATDHAGTTAITFGNGVHGQRLPTGVENVTAAYRSGIGSPGNVAPGQISQLATRPLGVSAVSNPLESSGGTDPETREAARANAPLAVSALDRLVSVSDYADFARTFAGVGKASSAWLNVGGRGRVQVTVAGAQDAPLDPGSFLLRNLTSALQQFGDPQLPVTVVAREELALVLSANVAVLPDYDWTLVEPVVRAALLARFGFEAMGLGRGVAASKVTATIAAVPGVSHLELVVLLPLPAALLSARLADLTGSPPPDPGQVPVVVPVLTDRVVDGTALPAQLACLQPDVPDSLILNEVLP